MTRKRQGLFNKPFKLTPSRLLSLAVLVLLPGLIVTMLISYRFYANDVSVSASGQTGTLTLKPKSIYDVANEDGSTFVNAVAKNWLGAGLNPTKTYLGIRFPISYTQPLPANVDKASLKVTKATLELWSPEAQIGVVHTEVYAEATPAPSPFTKFTKISTRKLTAAKTDVSLTNSWAANKYYSFDVTAQVQELMKISGANTRSISLIFKNLGTIPATGRYVAGDTGNGAHPAKLTVEYSYNTTGSTQTSSSTATTAPHTTTSAATTTAATTSQSTSSATTTASMTMSMTTTSTTTTPPTNGNTISHAYGLWSPGKFDTCTKEEHDQFHVQGPDGKWYPTWHPATLKRADGTTCTFGHEHGKDPRLSPLWPEIQKWFAHDDNGNGIIDDAELSDAGLPFGYVNEQMEILMPSMPRHEDHVGHKVELATNIRPWFNNNGTREYLNITCSGIAKVHQGTHSKDALANNIHEVVYALKCSDGNEVILTTMAQFGARGEFSPALPCDRGGPFGKVIQVGLDSTNAGYPNNRNAGFREIVTRDCMAEKFLVPSGQFSSQPYELWSLDDVHINTKSNVALTSGLALGFAVFDPIRYYDATQPNSIGHMMELCYEVESNGDRARGTCDVTNFGKITDITWDDPRAQFKDAHRETYFKTPILQNGNGPTAWCSDMYGNNAVPANGLTCQTGYIRQFIAAKNLNYGRDRNLPVDPFAVGADTNNDPSGTVHAPN